MKRYSLTLASLFLFATLATAASPLGPGPHDMKRFKEIGREVLARDEEGIGLMDKGQVQNVISNIGIISHFLYASPALHWPRNGDDVQQYGFGVNLIVATENEVIHSIYDPSSASQDFRWTPVDGSNGSLYNSNRTEDNTAADGVTPLLASSDRRSTWPVINGSPSWPGPFRESLSFPGVYETNQFTSDRDIYCEYTDTRGEDLRVRQLAYSYSRPYAEDIVFVRFWLHNDGNETLDSVYVGFQADLKPDFYADDRIGAWKMTPYDSSATEDNYPSFIYKVDLNGVPQRDDSSTFEQWVGPVGWIGLGFVQTPEDAGVSSFHYYHDDNSPVDDDVFAALLRNDASVPEHPDWYFHGSDPAFDDIALQEDVNMNDLPGSEITFTIGSGPFTLAPGDSTEFAIVLGLGADSTDLQENVETAYFMAKEKSYQGSGPPETPTLTARPGDGFVELFWNNVAEGSIDAITGRQDFEGYRLYKSTDAGETWGDPIGNWWGEAVNYVPIYTCDLVDSITGLDPAYSADFPSAHAWLGDDSGIFHRYVDDDVTNGIEVWYSLTSYDKGTYNPLYPDSTQPSYECGRGITQYESNTVAVTPGTRASDLNLEGISVELHELNDHAADGEIYVSIVNEAELTGHTYQVTFTDTTLYEIEDGDSIEVHAAMMNLFDVDRQSYDFTDGITGDLFTYRNVPLAGDAMPVVDGFRVYVEDLQQTGVRSMGWTEVAGDECTFDWWTENRLPESQQSYAEVVEGLDDWRITRTDTPVKIAAFAVGFGDTPFDSFDVAIRIEHADYEQGGAWEDVTEHLWISDLKFVFPTSGFVGPLGWDWEPGGDGYNPSEMGDMWMDILVLRDDEDDSTGSELWLKTQNGPATATAPSVGDQFTIITTKPFNGSLVYEFTTQAATGSRIANLSAIKAVPNPFIVKSGLERTTTESRMMFTHLPSRCTIDIYTVDGRKVRSLEHASAGTEGIAYWDLTNEHGQDVAYGLYIYIVKTNDGRTHQGKVMVIR